MVADRSSVRTFTVMNSGVPGAIRNDAFHITAATNMRAILADGFRTDSRGVLGTGAYFDLGNETTGLTPTRQRYPNQPVVVFHCEVKVGMMLDLDQEDIRRHFRRFQRQLVQHLGREAMLRLGHGGHIDLFLEALASAGDTYHTVQRTFVTDGQQRMAVRDACRVRVLSVRDVQRESCYGAHQDSDGRGRCRAPMDSGSPA